MAKFRDADGKEWELRVTAGHLRPLREEFGIDLRDALKPEDNSFAEALGDAERFGQILGVLLRPQLEKAGISPDEFGYRLDGETIERAGTALWQAVMDFYRPRTGEKAAAAFRTGLAKVTSRTNAAWDKVAESLTSSSGASNSEAPSASTPAPSPSGS